MSKYIDAEKLYKQVDSLMARYAKNEEEFEVDDEELSIFYQGKSKMCSEVLKIIDFLQQEQLLGIEEYGVPGKDFIPVEWVDACEKYGKWKIVQQEQPDFPTTDEQVKEFLATHPKVEVPEKYKTPNWLFDKQPSEDLEEAAEEYADKHGFRVPYDGSNNYYDDVDVKASKKGFVAEAKWQAKQLLKSSPLPEDTVLFKKGVEEGRRLERDDLALSIDDIEKIHVFLYAVKNNKQGIFTFTRLSDEQYKEVLRRFKEAKK